MKVNLFRRMRFFKMPITMLQLTEDFILKYTNSHLSEKIKILQFCRARDFNLDSNIRSLFKRKHRSHSHIYELYIVISKFICILHYATSSQFICMRDTRNYQLLLYKIIKAASSNTISKRITDCSPLCSNAFSRTY